MFALVAAMMCALGASAAEAYLNYTPSNTTLTFYYDNLRETRSGTTYDIDQYDMFGPAWCNDGTNENVTRVVFDPSFAEARPYLTMEWFAGMRNLQSITGLNYLNTSEVEYMQEMFYGCGSLTSLDLSNFNTDNVTVLSYMFAGCSGLTNLNLSNFNTGKVEYMSGMFAGCTGLTSLDLSNFNTARVEDMREMFCSCTALTNLDVSGFSTGSVTRMNAMFCDCINLTSLNLESFVTVNVENMNDMFNNCKKLTTITVGSGWSTDVVEDSDDMFTGCIKLVGGQGTTYDANHTDAEYAHIDGGPSNPGYLTGGREAYLVYTPSNTTMTFYYDKLRNTRPGQTYGINDHGFIFPAWFDDGTNANVTRVVFDPSFADARPYSTAEWFFEMSNLQSITGMNYLNTSSVQNMMGMFEGCSSLTSLDLSGFNTSSTVTMTSMFAGCTGLTSLDLSGFNTENVTEMRLMFYGCSGLTSLNVSNFDTKQVGSFQGMFSGCSSLTSLDLTSFNTENVAKMYDMFYGCDNLTTIYVGSEWDASYVGDSDNMFKYCTNLVGGAGTTYDANHIDAEYAHIDGGLSNPGYLSAVPEAYACYNPGNTTLTFYYDTYRNSRTGTTYDLNTGFTSPGWRSDGMYSSVTKVNFHSDFSNARPTSTYRWFCDMQNLETITGISYLNTSEVTEMRYMFYNCSKLTSIDLSHFNTAKVTKMGYMFSGCSALTNLDVHYLKTDQVTDMRSMFSNTTALTSLYLIDFNTAKVTNMSYMFYGCSNMTAIYVDGTWNTAAVTSSGSMFYNCTKLVGAQGTAYDANHIDKAYAHIDGGPSNPGYFTEYAGPEAYACYMPNGTMTFYYDTFRDRHTSMGGWTYALNSGSNSPDWYNDGISANVKTVVFSRSFANYYPSSTNHWFAEMSELTSVQGTQYLNTSEVTNMAGMFWECTTLPAVDVSGFDTHNVTDMNSMFAECYELNGLDVSGWNTGKVTDMSWLFSGCSELTSLDVSHFNTANVINMYGMFDGCSSLTSLDLSSFDTRKVTDMGYMFNYCSGLTSLDLSSFNTSNVTKMYCMFMYCRGLTSLNLNSFNTAKVTDMNSMFYDCRGLTSLDLSSFNTAKVTNMSYMFSLSENLRTIYAGNGWSTAAVASSNNMFNYCTSLVGGAGTTYNASHTDAAYAHIDGGASNPGYFSEKSAFLRGDVNGDGNVDVEDVTLLIAVVLGNATVNPLVADVNYDTVVDIEDVTTLIGRVLTGHF